MRLDSLYRTKSRKEKYDCSCKKNKITTNIKCNSQITIEPILSGTVLSGPLYLAVSCHLHQAFAVTLHWVPMGCFYRLPPVLYDHLKQDHSYISSILSEILSIKWSIMAYNGVVYRFYNTPNIGNLY